MARAGTCQPRPPWSTRRIGGNGLPGLVDLAGTRIATQPTLDRPARRRRDASLPQHPQGAEFAGRLDDPREHQRLEHLITAGRGTEPQHGVTRDNASSRCTIRVDVIGSAAPEFAGLLGNCRSSSPCPATNRCRATALSSSSSASACADPTCSISREPRRCEYTICTGRTPDAVFTVRAYGATTRQIRPRPPPRLVRAHRTEPQLTSLQPARRSDLGASQE